MSLFEKLRKNDKHYNMAFCDNCDWKGKPADCETYLDSEGWEYPSYQVAVCPKCKEESVIFCFSSF